MDGWEIWGIIAICIIPIIIFLTFYITRKLIEKQLRQNPPISEAQIRASDGFLPIDWYIALIWASLIGGFCLNCFSINFLVM